MSIFCLKQGRGLKALALTSAQNSLECPPPPPPPLDSCNKQEIDFEVLLYF